jgi:oligopeptide transport system ATP-binding protein
MSSVGSPLLEVRDLFKSFPQRRRAVDVLRCAPTTIARAVDGVSFVVRRGETLGIVGESGCGKSTLARCLVLLHDPDGGTILFEGKNVLALSGKSRREYNRRVQMVFQNPYGSLNPSMTVRACISEALAVHKIALGTAGSRRIQELLNLVGLPGNAADRYPHEFSGGQRQRICIARALAVRPICLVADEPVSALDVSVQAQIINLLLELQTRLQLAIVFITHDLRLLRHIAHHVAVMYLGRIIETGPAEEVFLAPRHPYTRALLAAVPKLRPSAYGETCEAVSGQIPSCLTPPSGCHFHPRCPIAGTRCSAEPPQLALRGGAWPVACHNAN